MDRIITLADHAKNQKNFSSPVDMAISDLLTSSLYETDFPFKDMHIDTSARLAQQFPVLTGKNLPTVDWVKINEDPTASKGTMRTKTRHVFHLRAPIEIDNAILNDPDKIWDPWQIQTEAYMKSIAYATKDTFFNGTPQTDDRAPVGLRYMVRNAAQFDIDTNMYGKLGDSGNVFYCGSASGIDLTSAGGAAAGNLALEALNKAFRYLGSPDGEGCVAFASGITHIQLASRVRQLGAGGGFSMTTDAYGRKIEMIRGCKLRDAGFKRNATTGEDTDEQIPLTQTVSGSADTGSTYTSIIVVNMNKNKFRAWQPRPLMAEPRPDTDFGKKRVIDWGLGLAEFSTRAFVEICGFKIS